MKVLSFNFQIGVAQLVLPALLYQYARPEAASVASVHPQKIVSPEPGGGAALPGGRVRVETCGGWGGTTDRLRDCGEAAVGPGCSSCRTAASACGS